MDEILEKLEALLKEIQKIYGLGRFQAMAFLSGIVELYLREYIEK